MKVATENRAEEAEDRAAEIVLPEGFDEWCASPLHGLGAELAAPLLEAICTEPSPCSVRLHRSKACSWEPFEGLPRVSWCPDGVYLPERPLFAADPYWHGGAYYVQEAGSMLLQAYAPYLQEAVGEQGRVLDLCAAPGGKSTLLREILAPGATLIANEWDRSRVPALVENLTRQGAVNVLVSHSDADALAAAGLLYDAVLVDAPCSGEGMFRKEEQARKDWSAAQVCYCAERQKEILREIWPSLKEGGLLLYSTCTYNRDENEEILKTILAEHDAEVLAPCMDLADMGLVELEEGVWRALPGRVASEGFSIFGLRKLDASLKPRKKQGKKSIYLPSLTRQEKELIGDIGSPLWRGRRGEMLAMSETARDDAQTLLEASVALAKTGCEIGLQKGRDLVPAQDWAMAVSLQTPYPRVEVDRTRALQFLCRESFVLDAPKGFLMLCYEGLPLGWVKNLGTRVNNLLPKGMMIYNKKILQ